MNTESTRHERMMDKIKALPRDCAQNGGETGVHIAGEHGAENAGKPRNFNVSTTEKHIAPRHECTKGGYSSAVERSVHIGEALGSTPSIPTIRRFKSIWDQGFAVHFWSRIAVGRPDECWPWRHSIRKDGYGQIKAGGRYWAASRLALTLSVGRDLGRDLALHHCDNPICCNPSHLYAGSKSDNERDKHNRGRISFRGERNPAAKLTASQITIVNDAIQSGHTNVEIAATLGVHHSTISKIRRGHSWK